MSFILAIEPDPQQSTKLADLVRRRLSAELVHAATTEGALAALAKIGDRVPDLVLVPSLLSPQEDAAIAGALRVIAAAANVRMLTIPMLADPEQPQKQQGMFARFRGRKAKATPGGCDPDVFADQIAAYLAEAAAERKARHDDEEPVDASIDEAVAPVIDAPVVFAIEEPAPIEPLPLVWPVAEPMVVAEPEQAPRVTDAWPDRVGDAIREIPDVIEAAAPLVVDEPQIIVSVAEFVAPTIDEPVATAEPAIVAGIEEPVVVYEEPVVAAAEQTALEPIVPAPFEEAVAATIEEPTAFEPIVAAAGAEAERSDLIVAPMEQTVVVAAEETVAAVEDTVVDAVAETVVAALEETVVAASEETVVAAVEQTLAEPTVVAPIEEHVVPTVEEPIDATPVAVEPIWAETIAAEEIAAEAIAAKAIAVEAITVEAIAEESIAPESIVVAAVEEPIVTPVEEPVVAAVEPPVVIPVEQPVAAAPREEVPEPLVASVVEEPVVVDIDAPVAAAADESVVTVPETVRPAKRPRASRPERKRKETSREIEEIDIDALIAPLLSEIAAKRSEPRTVDEFDRDDATAFAREEKPAASAGVTSSVLAREEQPAASVGEAAPALSAPVVPPDPIPDDIDPMFFADDAMAVPPPSPAQAERSAWIELVESLRQDIERLKAERTADTAPPPPVQQPISVVAPAISSIRRRPVAPPEVHVQKAASKLSRVRPRRPIEDQWGLFDPEQCGFAALLAKLDEIGARDEASA